MRLIIHSVNLRTTSLDRARDLGDLHGDEVAHGVRGQRVARDAQHVVRRRRRRHLDGALDLGRHVVQRDDVADEDARRGKGRFDVLEGPRQLEDELLSPDPGFATPRLDRLQVSQTPHLSQ